MGFPKGVQEARSWSFWLFSFVPPTVFIGCLEITKITWRHQVLEDEGIFKRIARAATPIIMVIIPRSMIRLCQLFCDHQEHLDPEAVRSTSSSKGLESFSSIPKHLNHRCSVDEPPALQATDLIGEFFFALPDKKDFQIFKFPIENPEAVPSTSSLPAQPSKSLGSFSSIPKCLNRRCSVDEPPAVQDPFSKGEMDQKKSAQKASTTGRRMETTGIGLSAVESISIRGVAKDLKKKTEHIWRWMERRE
ncbi:hypothetical protein B9Z55_016099 [Caenorhabditis nigoni]|uniref:Uncharacterized protein n=1 Tax=Caenorhabditis nigoni TaxID=1611254 RepID=A0A2G5UDE2_9PELO|nr:hypothetical protein B9Z55_016099 [Caenorhabditis nigoni]